MRKQKTVENPRAAPAEALFHFFRPNAKNPLHKKYSTTIRFIGFTPVPEFMRESPIKTAEISTEQNYNMIDGTLNIRSPVVSLWD